MNFKFTVIVLLISLRSFAASVEHKQKIFENCEQGFEWIKQQPILDEGFNIVHEACKIGTKICDYVAKAFFDMESFSNEVYWLNTLASTAIVPKLYVSYQCTVKSSITDPGRFLGVVIMEKFDGQLSSLLRQKENYGLLNNVASFLDTLAKLKIVHGDIKTDNVLYKNMPNGKIKFVIIDWESARTEDNFSLFSNRVRKSTYWTYNYGDVPYFNRELKNEGQHLYYDKICLERDLLQEFGILFLMQIPNDIRMLLREQFGYTLGPIIFQT